MCYREDGSGVGKVAGAGWGWGSELDDCYANDLRMWELSVTAVG